MSEHFTDPSVRKSIDVDLALLERYDDLITDLELMIVRDAKRHDGDGFHRLRSVPGIGKVLALTILYEIHDISRFDRVQEFASYARLVKCAHTSAGKTLGTGGAKMGNVHLKVGVLGSRRALPAPRARREDAPEADRKEARQRQSPVDSRPHDRTGVFCMLSRRTVFSMDKSRAA